MSEQDKIYGLMVQAEELQTHAQKLQTQAEETFKGLPLAVIQSSKEIQRRGLIQALFVLSFGIIVAVIAWAVLWWTTDSLRAEKKELLKELPILQAKANDFATKAGKANITFCGEDKRLCIEVDEESRYGNKGELFLIIKGY